MSSSTATCDWANGRATNTCAVSGGTSLAKRLDLKQVAQITQPKLRPKPAHPKSNVPTRVEFIAVDLTDKTYSAVIKIQTDQKAFTGNWAISFNIPAGQTVDSTSRGSISVSNNVAIIKSDPSKESPKNMAVIFKVSGTHTGGYSLPDTSSAIFLSV
ncbi:hypothetical protein GGI26_002375 [Coemansia sp. RSA 1358]|nr:hypothetical protein EDC05_002180 [Coemansia umbellata]KAJ2623536.1 hypothetical protein GGI26_002375 [Coemansia sp. RSA 1358]